jgi:predicted ATPase
MLATLEALLVQAVAGQGQAVGIVGKPGIGKSRLVYEFRRALRGQRLTYLAGGGLAYGQHTPYLPVCTLLRTFCGLTAAESPTVSVAKVHRRLSEVGLAPEEWAPYLLRLLDLPMAPNSLATLSPQAIRARTTEALVQCALQGAGRQPLVLEVENLHWIDPSLEEVLTALAERLGGAAVLLLTTFRPGYHPPRLDKSYASQVALAWLSPADSRRVVQAVRRSRPLPETLLQAILGKADGNPFFLEELTRAMVAHDTAQSLPSVVPDTVQAVLAARLDRLPSPAKRLLQVAAVIGKDVPLAQLRAVAGLPETVLDEQLTQLQAGEFLYEVFLESTPGLYLHTCPHPGGRPWEFTPGTSSCPPRASRRGH